MKLVIFDLDGVLVNTKVLHFDALNLALKKCGLDPIYFEEHIRFYDGLPTSRKLELLARRRNITLSPTERDEIWARKQEATELLLSSKIGRSEAIHRTFRKLRKDGVGIAIATNSIYATTKTIIRLLEIEEYVDLIITNQNVTHPKPHPQMYMKAMVDMNAAPADTVIVEDSPHGIAAAEASGARVLVVRKPEEVTYENVINFMNNNQKKSTPAWTSSKLNVLIPMAGAGSRFEAAGYTFPKPLIDVNGKPMIQTVVENLNIRANYIFIVQKSHYEKYNLNYMLNLIAPNCKVVQVDGVTEGAACTSLLARKYIDNDNDLLIANSDQFVEWDSSSFIYSCHNKSADGAILTFKNTHPKWSYVKLDKDGVSVTEVAEKRVISDTATVGIYYWTKGSDYCTYADKMIEENDRVNNEFYIAPIFNHAIRDGKKIITHNIEKMYGLGTPEDLNNFLRTHE